jgi:ubiquitin-protein ligase
VHRLEITLPSGYPRDAPLFRMLTPVFHPNIAPHAVCIADHWTAGQSLDALIQRVGEMLAFQSYNTKSPLNGLAAQWVEENIARLPVEAEEFFLDLDARAPGRTGAG